MNEIQYVNLSVSRAGKEKVIANQEKGRRGSEKDAHLKTPPSFMCRILPRFQPKQQPKNTTWFIVEPPILHRGLEWFYKEPPSPLTDHVVCRPFTNSRPGPPWFTFTSIH